MQDNKEEFAVNAKTATKRLDPNTRKAQLLEHAIAAFAEAGIERAGHSDVAGRAKVSTATVFKYFPTRDALVDAVLTEIESAFMNLGGLKSNEVVLPLDQMTQVIAGLISDLCVTKPYVMKVGLLWSVAFSDIRERYDAFENMRLDDLQNMVSSPDFVRTEARIFFTSMFLFIRMHFDGTPSEARQSYIERLIQLFGGSRPSKA